MYSNSSRTVSGIDTNQNTISPPPAKRRRTSGQDGSSGAIVQNSSSENLPNATASKPAPHWISVYSWNINGIAAFLQPSMLSYMKPRPGSHALHKTKSNAPITTSLRNFLRRHDWPQLLHLQEVKINPSDEATQRSVQHAVNLCRSGPDDGPSYTVKFCLPRDKFNATGFGRKVYGVATIIRDDFLESEVTAVREVDWDIEGRVLVVETKSKVAFFNIYAVNGTTNAYRDPATGNPMGTRHDRKLVFHRCLLDECRRLESEGWRLVLAGDFNIAPAAIDGYPSLRTKPEQHVRNRNDFNKKFLGSSTTPQAANGVPNQETQNPTSDGKSQVPDEVSLGAVDSFRHLYPDSKRYTFMPRNKDWMESCDRVDMILLSKSLVQPDQETLKEANILMVEAERGPSDHVPLFVWLDLEADKGIFEE